MKGSASRCETTANCIDEGNPSDIKIFIGPQKTGTSLIFKTINGALVDKEMLFPLRFGRSYVFKKFVVGKRILVWPYLAHKPERLWSLLRCLDECSISYTLVETTRQKGDWIASMTRFRMKSGATPQRAKEMADEEWRHVQRNLSLIRQQVPIECCSIFERSPDDIAHLARILGQPIVDVASRLEEIVYATEEQSRMPSRALARTYFTIKPFLPGFMRNMTRLKAIRSLFFKSVKQ